ncbi:hypothetical protein D915_002340 [Fasciola hepatica]|uniref:Delta-like protein n=1 Tax=Fasciola hepatica TaxID=6192 RepID=A0A4E0S361_FASHE|nr:hypothetical protein D915_002340 [Fasciola hepatica]
MQHPMNTSNMLVQNLLKMHLKIWINFVCLLFVYRVSLEGVHADARIHIQFQLWEPPDFRPASICCPADQSVSMLDLSQRNISNSTVTCRQLCNLYADFCLGTHEFADDFNAPRGCQFGRNISSLDHENQWPNSSLSELEFPVQGRLPPYLTVTIRILRRNNPEEPSKSWTRLVLATFHQSEVNPSRTWTVHRRDLPTVDQLVSPANVSITPEAVPHMVLGVRMSCKPNFHGPDCGQFCQPMRGPHGNFICEQETGVRKCLPGWTGQRCTEAICDPVCRHGTCVRPNYCKCRSGWQGEACELCQVYPGCVHGTCKRNTTNSLAVPFTCDCLAGWGGMQCDIDLQYCQRIEGVCENGGLCINTRSRSELFHRCVCPPQFYGRRCEKRVTGCELEGCGLHGMCVLSPNGTHVCKCDSDYCGKNCQLNGSGNCQYVMENATIQSDLLLTNCTENSCLNGGVCEIRADHQEQKFVCHCPPGFTGLRCNVISLINDTADPYLNPQITLNESNMTEAIKLNSFTYFSGFYRSSLVVLLLVFFLLLCGGMFAHCVHSYQQSKPHFVNQSQLTYSHIANNLVEFVSNPMLTSYEAKSLRDIWVHDDQKSTPCIIDSKQIDVGNKWNLVHKMIKFKCDPTGETFAASSKSVFHSLKPMPKCRTQLRPQAIGWYSSYFKPYEIRLSSSLPPDRSNSV